MNRDDQGFLLYGMNWTSHCGNLWELLTAILLDTQTPIERVNDTVKYLKERNLLDYRILSNLEADEIAKILKESGYIWYNQRSKLFGQEIDMNLNDASLEDMMTIRGIGPKLASLWMRIVHGTDIPIIDTHVKKWLRGQGHDSNNYSVLSEALRKEAAELNMTVTELDNKIVLAGIKKRKGILYNDAV